MNFFKKLFSEETKTKVEPINTKMKKTIFDFFEVDLNIIPDETFIKAETIENVSGNIVEVFRKNISYKECDLFDTIEIRLIDNKCKNFSFKNYNLSTIKMDKIKVLIDDLYLIYGNDSSNKGKFTSKDIQEYNDKEFYTLFGRSWHSPENKLPVAISKEENEFEITIWGVSM